MDEKQSMERAGIHRYPYQGTCGICEGWHEQVFAIIIDLCRHCTQKAVIRWQDKKIYFKLISVKPNMGILKNRCQMCNRKDIIMNQVNIKMCHGARCLKRVGKLDHFKNRPEKKITVRR